MSFLSFLSNPVTLAFVTVAAIGVVVYNILNTNEERAHTNRGGRKRRNDSDAHDHDTSYSTYNQNSDSYVRQRQKKCDDGKSKACYSKEVVEESTEQKSYQQNDKESQFDVKNYKRKVFDKIENDLKNINQKDEALKHFEKNIDDVSCVIHENGADNLNNTKLINVPDANQSNTPVNITENSHDVASQDNCSSSTDATVVASADDQVEENNSNVCKACNVLQSDAVANPCGHCYLCAECAVIIHRIYKKCYICELVVQHYSPASLKT